MWKKIFESEQKTPPPHNIHSLVPTHVDPRDSYQAILCEKSAWSMVQDVATINLTHNDLLPLTSYIKMDKDI